jgi:hypothetical protein
MTRSVLAALAMLLLGAGWAGEDTCHPTPRGLSPLPPRHGFERDHLVSLCLGGTDDASNVWYQPIGEARVKDRLEAAVCRLVCDEHRMPLSEAQAGFRTDWRALYRRVFGVDP